MKRKATMRGLLAGYSQRFKSLKPVEASRQRAPMLNATAAIKTLVPFKTMPKIEQRSSASGSRARLKPTTSAKCSRGSGSDSKESRL